MAAYNDQSGNGEYSGTLFNPQYGKANAYRQKLIAEAKKFGISADQVMSLKHPVLVRIRDNDPKVDKRSFIQAANTSQNMVMSSTETALQDGEIMKEFIDKFSSENLESKSNAEFVREFLKKVCAGSELNSKTLYRCSWQS